MTDERQPPSHRKGRLDILMIIGSLNVGGAERHVAQVAPALAGRGWRTAVYCLSEPGILGNQIRKRGLHVEARRIVFIYPGSLGCLGVAFQGVIFRVAIVVRGVSKCFV